LFYIRGLGGNSGPPFFSKIREDKALAVEAPRFGKGSGAKEDSSPASIFGNYVGVILELFEFFYKIIKKD
jgi:hypothetical protein